MIKTQELKSQMEALTKQNDIVLLELEMVKKMLLNSDKPPKEAADSSESESSNSPSQSADSDGSSKQKGKDQSGNNDESSSEQQQAADQQSSSSSDNQAAKQQVSQIANDLLNIKDLVEKLEQKTAHYVSSQANGGLSEKDVVNLVLTLMNGMVDWASEFVSKQSSGSGQIQ
jgi:hypothetical protein